MAYLCSDCRDFLTIRWKFALATAQISYRNNVQMQQ